MNSAPRSKTATAWDWTFKVLIMFWALFTVCLLPWSIWVTTSIFESSYHIKASEEMIKKMDKIDCDLDDIKKEITLLPNPEWRKKVEILEAKVSILRPEEWQQRLDRLENWDRENRADHAAILISLKAIEAKLGIENK